MNRQTIFGQAVFAILRKSKREATPPTSQRTVASHLLLPQRTHDMKVIRYDIDPLFDGYDIVAGESYLCDETILNDFNPNNTNIPIIESDNPKLKSFDPADDWNEKKILVVRHGGFGDLLFLTPIFREIKKRWNRVSISVCCGKKYSEALSTNKDIDNIIAYPIKANEITAFHAVIHFVYSNEKEKRNQEIHIVDLFAETINLQPIEDKTISLYIPDNIIEDAKQNFPRTNFKRIGIQVYAANSIRSYPFFQMKKLISLLIEKGFEIFLFGSENQINYSTQKQIINLTTQKITPTFLESAATMTTCDLFIAPDSSLCHVAGALKIPTVALYGSFPSKQRTKFASSIKAIDATGSCAPCFHHTFGGVKFPRNQPCESSGYCNVLATIEPETIINSINTFLTSKTNYINENGINA